MIIVHFALYKKSESFSSKFGRISNVILKLPKVEENRSMIFFHFWNWTLYAIELRLERIVATSIARFNFNKIGRGRLWFCLYFPSLKQSLIEVELIYTIVNFCQYSYERVHVVFNSITPFGATRGLSNTINDKVEFAV